MMNDSLDCVGLDKVFDVETSDEVTYVNHSIPNIVPGRLGIAIHREQREAVQKIKRELSSEDPKRKHPLIIAGPQQGKSGVAISVSDSWLHTQLYVPRTLTVFWITNVAQKTLRDQMTGDIFQASLEGSVTAALTTDLKYISVLIKENSANGIPTLIVDDECSYNLELLGRLDTFYKEIGFDPRRRPEDQKNKLVQVVFISATSYPQSIEPTLYYNVVLEKSSSYFGLEELWNSGRLHNGFKHARYVANNGQLLLNIFDELYAAHGSGGDYRRWIIRVPTHKAALEFKEILIKFRPKENYIARIFGSNPNSENTRTMLRESAYGPIRFEIDFIIKTLTAGNRFESTRYIARWDDMLSKQTDTVVQSIGRLLGYDNRHEDPFSIYCNMAEIERAIDFNKGKDNKVSGTYVKPLTQRVGSIGTPFGAKTLDEINAMRRAHGYLEVLAPEVRNIGAIGSQGAKDKRVRRPLENCLRNICHADSNDIPTYRMFPQLNSKLSSEMKQEFQPRLDEFRRQYPDYQYWCVEPSKASVSIEHKPKSILVNDDDFQTEEQKCNQYAGL